MGHVHMFNTFSSNLQVRVNAGSNTYPIRAAKKSTGYTPSQSLVERGSPAAGDMIANGSNTFIIQPVNNNNVATGTPVSYHLTVPDNIDITNDLVIYFFFNQLILLDNAGFLISKVGPSQ